MNRQTEVLLPLQVMERQEQKGGRNAPPTPPHWSKRSGCRGRDVLKKEGDDYICTIKDKTMKRLIILALALLGSAMVSRAQDIITTRSGEDIQAKVQEVSPLVIKYKRFSNPDGPTYSISTGQVLMIRYENGEKDIFDGAPVNTAFSDGPVLEGLRYKELRYIYSPKMYIRQFDDRYSPGWLGVASFVIPGLARQ